MSCDNAVFHNLTVFIPFRQIKKTLNDRECHVIETFVSVWRGLHQKPNEGNVLFVFIKLFCNLSSPETLP